ncbi:hypothetical protein, partial [uncultured Vagococcus sp.]|uniref:hypothetical protein n=1 Tax=uncultured Vagococcus sp. TaxID=189676 RepID=UPI0028D85D44
MDCLWTARQSRGLWCWKSDGCLVKARRVDGTACGPLGNRGLWCWKSDGCLVKAGRVDGIVCGPLGNPEACGVGSLM